MLDQQLDLDGGLHDVERGRHVKLKLFEPAPIQLEGQLDLSLDTNEETMNDER